jgi:hypothetical protein
LFVYDSATGDTTTVSADPSLDYDDGVSLTADGMLLAYTAWPTGSSYVPYVHVYNLGTSTDKGYAVQTNEAPEIAGDGSFIAYQTYQGFYNPGQAILWLPSGGSFQLDNGVNGVFGAQVPWNGTCIAVHSWEQDGLTDDLANRGLSYYYDDVYTYDPTTDTYARVTNTFDGQAIEGAFASAGCNLVAVSASEHALAADGVSNIDDVYVTKLH